MSWKAMAIAEFSKRNGLAETDRFARKLLGLDSGEMWEAFDGGPGSGNWGHRGRPGKVGGSGKGSGGATFRSGSKESGYKSFAKTEEFKSILKCAREHRSWSRFMDALPRDHFDALMEQKKIASPDEDQTDYIHRIYDMLSVNKPKEKSPGWYEALEESDKDELDQYLGDHGYDSFGELITEYGKQPVGKWSDGDTIKTMLGKAGEKSGWGERVVDRQFENLSGDETEDINLILNEFPWNDDPRYANIPSEERVLTETSDSVRKYYFALKAKALGIDGVEVPKRPEGVEYLRNHPGKISGMISKQDGGYVHTKAGDKFRKSVEKKLESSPIFNAPNVPEVEGYKKRIMAGVENMDDRMAELVDRTIGRALVNWEPLRSTSNFDGRTITLYVRDSDGNPLSEEDIESTFWHEYGHFVDSWVSHSGMSLQRNPLFSMHDEAEGATAIMMASKEYSEAAEKDIQGLIEAAGLGDKYYASKQEFGTKILIRRKSDDSVMNLSSSAVEMWEVTDGINNVLKRACGYDKFENFMSEQGYPKDIEWTDYFETYTTPKRRTVKTRGKFKGAEEAYREAVIQRGKEQREFIERIGGDEAFSRLLMRKEALYREYDERRKKMGYVTDCIDDAVNGQFTLAACWGAHDIEYYEKKRVPLETTANIFSIRARNNADEVAFMESMIPNISRLATRAWRCDGDERN